MIAYKLIKRESGGSVYAGGDYLMIYEIGKVVRAPKGTLGIFCFVDLKSARDFHGTCSLHNILEVTANRRDIIKVNSICIYQSGEGLSKFYRGIYCGMMKPPRGTICFKKIRVLRYL